MEKLVLVVLNFHHFCHRRSR